MKCTCCGKEVVTGARFCSGCGMPVLDATVRPKADDEIEMKKLERKRKQKRRRKKRKKKNEKEPKAKNLDFGFPEKKNHWMRFLENHYTQCLNF